MRMLGCSGIGTYLHHLIPLLPPRLPDAEFVLFGDPARARRLLPGAATAAVRAPIYSVAEQAALPLAAAGRGLDLFFAPHYNAPLLLRTPQVVTVHDLIHLLFPGYLPRPRVLARWYARTLMRAACARARVVFCPSGHTRRDLVRHLGVAVRKIRVTPLGVDHGFARARRPDAAFRRRHGLGDRYVLYVGNLKPHKNLERLVSAFARLPDRGLTLALAGAAGGAYAARLRGLAQAEGVEGRVVFPGLVARGELGRLYAGARVFAFPSLYEGFGLPPLEAMACGTPVVASRAASLPETVGDAAVLVDPRSPAAIAAGIRAVLERPALRARLVRRGRARAEAATWDRTADLTARALRGALAAAA